MTEIEPIQDSIDDSTDEPVEDRRCRGRPQIRPDDETRGIIFEAARSAFADSGYAATSMEAVARQAGVSTKTLYRLIPNKAALFEGMVTDRLDRTLATVDLRAIDHADIEEALYAVLMACAELTLDEEVIALQRMVLQEARKTSDIGPMFYRNGIARIAAALADWLRTQQTRGLIALDDAEEAAGMLLGMIASAPRRAAMFGGVPLPPRPEIEARVRRCAALFLKGCQVRRVAGA
jgi:AcrR family transcriptional regulator